MTFAAAGHTYTLLTVGDGLVTQIPALIVSTAAGLLVSKAGVSGAADQALLRQLSGYPKALGMSAGVMIVMAHPARHSDVSLLHAWRRRRACIAYFVDKRTRVTAAAGSRESEPRPQATSPPRSRSRRR